ncbi:MAG: aldose 1-epimerase [Bryobacteraceae bacterium]|nr:aldose 1-epimerase [Bryobacteraceae bacterium]
MRAVLLLCLPLLSMLPVAGQRYEARIELLDDLESVVLRDRASETVVRIVPALGNNVWEMTVRGQPVFWSPYGTVAEYRARPAHFGNPFLWPWANRIDGTAYWVNGKKYLLNPELGNVRPGPNNTPIHGLLVHSSPWQLAARGADANGARAASRLEFWRRPELMAQFPFAHAVAMTYRLAAGALAVETVIENLSDEPMPVSLGFHPYFRITDAPRDEWVVTLAARRKHLLDARLIPTGQTAPLPYAKRLKLEGVVLDDVLDDLKRDPDGMARFRVEGRRQKITVEYGAGYGVAVVYAPAGREFVCFEPMTAITNAFNAAHAGWYRGLPHVAPRGRWSGAFRVVPEGH